MSFNSVNVNCRSDCSICLNPISGCGAVHEGGGEHHPYHFGCLMRWVETQQQRWQAPTCPSCRTLIDRIDQSVINPKVRAVFMDGGWYRVVENPPMSWFWFVNIRPQGVGLVFQDIPVNQIRGNVYILRG